MGIELYHLFFLRAFVVEKKQILYCQMRKHLGVLNLKVVSINHTTKFKGWEGYIKLRIKIIRLMITILLTGKKQ